MEFLFTKKATVRAFTFPLYHNEIRFAQLGEFNPLEFDQEKWIFHRFFKLSSQKSVKHSHVLRLWRYYLEFLFWSFHSTIIHAEYFEYLVYLLTLCVFCIFLHRQVSHKCINICNSFMTNKTSIIENVEAVTTSTKTTSGLFGFLERWSHRQHIDKRLVRRQTINSRQATLTSGFFSCKVTLPACGSGPAQIVFLLIITLLY